MMYYAIINGQQQGPFTLYQLPYAGVGPDTYVWCKTMERWQPAREVADICRFYRQHLAAVMHPGYTPPRYGAPPAGIPDRLKDARSDVDDDFPMRWRYVVEKAGERPVKLPEAGPDLSRKPRYMLWEAVVVLLLCCPPIGVAALWYSLKSRRLWRAGRAAEAHDAARTTRILVLLGCCFALIIYAVIGNIL